MPLNAPESGYELDTDPPPDGEPGAIDDADARDSGSDDTPAAGDGNPPARGDKAPAATAPKGEPADGGDEAADDDGTEWLFDSADIKPETETLGEGLDDEAIAKIDMERIASAKHDERARREVEKQLDDEGRQRRQNVRVMVQFPVTLRISGHAGSRSRTRDLSATGIGFATRLPLEVNTIGSVTIHFPDWNFTKAFVVRFVKPILAGRQIGAQFRELTEDERERVVKEVFAVQRAQLQAERARKQISG